MSASILPPLPTPLRKSGQQMSNDGNDKAFFDCYSNEQMTAYGQACRVDLLELVRAVHKAKGRYHSQLAMCDLFDAAGLPNTRPEKSKKNAADFEGPEQHDRGF